MTFCVASVFLPGPKRRHEHRDCHQMTPTIYYFAPDFDQPSWGTGLLYRHVQMLCRNGYRAAIVQRKPAFRLSWLETDVPRVSLDEFRPQPQDIFVVPEFAAEEKSLLHWPCRRFVFVQGSFLIVPSLKTALDYRALGYEHAITTMPHIQAILKQHHGIRATVVPVCIASYFFSGPGTQSNTSRKRQVVLFPKAAYHKAGYYDYEIVKRLLAQKLSNSKDSANFWVLRDKGWKIIELDGYTHRQVARILQESAFLVNVNCLESFNATVPEAMAAGCIPICYEAYGGQDFLQDGKNAYVFPNNYAYPLLNKLFALIDSYDDLEDELVDIRAQAYATACQYTEAQTERALVAFYRSRLS